MVRNKVLYIMIVVVTLFSQPEYGRFVAYFTSWSVYARDFHVTDIPADRLTHINYAFANVSDGEIVLGDPYADVDKFYDGDSWHTDSLRGSFHQLQLLKQEYPHLKTLISVGGWTWSTGFSDVALTNDSRERFAVSCVEFVDAYGFDGIDIDWEYPVEGGAPGMIHRPQDRENYKLLCAKIREMLDSLSLSTGKDYILSIAAPASVLMTGNFDLLELSETLDFINIMSYDYHGPFGGEADAVTNFNSPLAIEPSNPLSEPYRTYFNVIATVDTFLNAGVPPEKLNLGLAFYGRGYSGVTGGYHGLFSEYSGASSPGTWETGVYDFDDLYDNYIDIDDYIRYWAEGAEVPWLFNDILGIFISYEDTLSLSRKMAFIRDMGLGGAMCWELSADRDSRLINTVFEGLNHPADIFECSHSSDDQEIQVYPNPFNLSCSFVMPDEATITVFDVKGNEIIRFCGSIISWTPTEEVSSGVYHLRMVASDGHIATGEVVYIK